MAKRPDELVRHTLFIRNYRQLFPVGYFLVSGDETVYVGRNARGTNET